ncbi:MAG TPA: ACT domain-containing protein [Opitutaceae bacterium]|nr:ACT domain-containing protein [Opitutaceae bacterium]HND60735.1 ACT domain-containing protein [Opitutaceae bacterium]
MSTSGQTLRLLPGNYGVCRLPAGSSLPVWATGEFVSITVTGDEVSVMCPESSIPPGFTTDLGWRVLKVMGPFPFSTVGIMASLTAPLAAAGISLLAVATYDTDYVLVKADKLDAALAALTQAGHRLDS